MTLPHGGGPAPIYGVDHRPSEGEIADLDKALPQQPLHLALVASGEREQPGWWGPGRPATWADAVDAVRVVAEVAGPRGGRALDRPRTRGTPAAARRSPSATS